MNDTTYAYDAGGAAGPGTNGSDSYGSNPYGSPAPGPQPKPKRQSDRFFSWIRGSAMERGALLPRARVSYTVCAKAVLQ